MKCKPGFSFSFAPAFAVLKKKKTHPNQKKNPPTNFKAESNTLVYNLFSWNTIDWLLEAC